MERVFKHPIFILFHIFVVENRESEGYRKRKTWERKFEERRLQFILVLQLGLPVFCVVNVKSKMLMIAHLVITSVLIVSLQLSLLHLNPMGHHVVTRSLCYYANADLMHQKRIQEHRRDGLQVWEGRR